VPNSMSLLTPFVLPLHNSNIVLMLAWNTTSSQIVYSVAKYGSWFGNTSIAYFSSLAVPLKSLQSATRVNDTMFLASDRAGNLVTLVLNQDHLYASAVQHVGATNSVVYAVTTFNRVLQGTLSCALALDNSCLVVDAGGSLHDADAVDVNVNTTVIAYATADNRVFVGLRRASGAFIASQIGVGTTVSLSTAKGFLLLTTSDSYCYNNEYNNKEIVAICSINPTSTRGVLVYWYGPQSNWEAWLSDSQNPNKAISSCNAKIAHATFDQGSSSSASLIVDVTNTIRLLEIHQGVSVDAMQFPQCGNATMYNGLVIDSFDVSQYNF
jgi:hypothetical protein